MTKIFESPKNLNNFEKYYQLFFWKNDKREGRGIYYYNDGDRYEGEWKNDNMEGKGIFSYKNGDIEIGDYSQNQKVGKHVRMTSNGKIETEFYNQKNQKIFWG